LPIFKKLKHWYEENETRISVVSLILGFIVDSLTLQRIDTWGDNLWILANLMMAGACIIFLNRGKPGQTHFWYSNILQFSFGALLGSIFVFYLRSTTLAVTWPFLAILLMALIGNEIFQKRYEKLAFQLSFFYFSLFSFSIFLVPLAVKKIGPDIFFLSGLVSLLVFWIFSHIVHRFTREKFIESRTHIRTFVAIIFVGINLLYFTNLIPPIPLALKDSGIYHSITRHEDGNYVVTGEVRGFEKYFDLRPKIYWQEGETLYAYTAIFSPGSLNTDVVHLWQYRDAEGKWIVATRTALHLSGGRSGGFRTFSDKANFTPGAWRVDVETRNGQIIGRISFEIVSASTTPNLTTYVKK
jgi:hypothetical protein